MDDSVSGSRSPLFRTGLTPLQKAISSVSLLGLLATVAGFAREVLTAALYGNSREMDVFFLSWSLVTAVGNLVATAVRTSMIPVLVQYRLEARRLASSMINAMALILVLCAAVLGLFSSDLVSILAAETSPETLALGATLVRVLAPGMVFIGMVAILSGWFHFQDVFWLPAAMPLLGHIVTTAILWLGQGRDIRFLAWAVLIGLATQVLSLWLLRGWKGALVLERRHPGLRTLSKLAWPAVMSSVVTQGHVVMERTLAAHLTPVGGVSALGFASRIAQVPVTVFGSAIATVLFPVLAKLAADGGSLDPVFGRGWRLTLVINVPLVVLFLFLPREIVAVLLKRGAFDAAATQATARALSGYALWILFTSWTMLLAKVYYAYRNVRTPFWTGLLASSVGLTGSFLMAVRWGVVGVAAGTSIAAALNVGLLWFFMRRRLPPLHGVLRDAAAAVIAGAAMAVVSRWYVVTLGSRSLQDIAVTALLGGVVYLLMVVSLGLITREEIRTMVAAVLRGRQQRIKEDDN